MLLIGCSTNQPIPSPSLEPQSELKLGKKLSLWATAYFSPHIKSNPNEKYCLEDKNNKCISPKIRHDQMCFIQMQGSGKIDNKFFTFSGRSRKTRFEPCYRYGQSTPSGYNVWSASNQVRFSHNKNTEYGKGSFDNELVPFLSIACPKKYKNLTKFFIPAAKGVKLPNGEIHDGIFRCDDRGGAIKGNQIDVFIGLVDMRTNWKMNDWARAARSNPFKFVKSSKEHTFNAYEVIE